jgi:hypothetical protein
MSQISDPVCYKYDRMLEVTQRIQIRITEYGCYVDMVISLSRG